MRLLESVRARIALWYAGVFALLLVGFAVAAYLFVATTTRARIDEYLAETADAVAGALADEYGESHSDGAAVASVLREFRFRDIGLAVYDPGGAALGASAAHPLDNTTPAPPPLPAPWRGHATAATIGSGRRTTRVYAIPVTIGARPMVIAVSQSLRGQQRTLAEMRATMMIAIPLALLLASAGGYALAWKSLHPVVQMSEQAARIGATTLHERLPVANEHDELGRLATVFNDLLARIARAFDQQRQFTADASHELRTPVAIVAGEAELALARADRPAAEYRDALATIEGEARRLRRIVDDLFFLARANAGERLLAPGDMYLDEVVGECVRAGQALAARKGITLAYVPGDEMPFRGDEALVRRLVMNLIDNAVKYTPPGGRVAVAAERRDGRYRIRVRDTGPGIPRELQGHIFERFYRVRRLTGPTPSPAAPGADSFEGGAGLGLSISRWIAEAHGGTLALASSDDGGSEFVAELRSAES